MRNHLDFYETPPWQTRALLRRVGVTGSILECCVGDSSLANVLRDHELNVATSDIDPKRTADHHLDATQEHNWRKLAPDWTITNPPFNKAIEIVQNAYHHSRVGVAMLLRLSFLEPTDKRGGWLAETPPPRA